jgi:predicted dienelactone hydrolase
MIPGRTHTFSAIAAVAVAIAACSDVATASPPPLPAPDGAYAVGVATGEFVDASRLLDASDPAGGPRRLPAVAWYPAQAADGDAGSAYMDGDHLTVTLPAIARNFGYAADDLHALATARLAVRPQAPPARHGSGFPVVVFSHGFFLYPRQNSALASRLASHGYIVVSIAHPGDAADLRLRDGRTIATAPAADGDDPRLAQALGTLAGGDDLAARRAALPVYAEALPATRIGRSFVQWREDTLSVARAIAAGDAPAGLGEALAAADRSRLAFAGMSFGGATAATTCRLVAACAAAVNLDGQNFDPDLYDRAVERPLLLMLSDWPRYGLLAGQPREADFSPNDLAYERWSRAGDSADVVRVRVEGLRHMGFTDLVALLDGPEREARVGGIDGGQALSAIGDLVLAFLDAHLRDGDDAAIARTIKRHGALVRHAPTRLRAWADAEERADQAP